MEKIFIDSDIILDLFAKRDPFYQDAADLFALAEKGKVKAHVSPIIIANLYYVLRKLRNKEQALRTLHKLKLLVKILPVNEKIIEMALTSEFKDFEDAIEYYTAKEGGITSLITRNIKDYKRASISIMTAGEYLDQFSSRNNQDEAPTANT